MNHIQVTHVKDSAHATKRSHDKSVRDDDDSKGQHKDGSVAVFRRFGVEEVGPEYFKEPDIAQDEPDEHESGEERQNHRIVYKYVERKLLVDFPCYEQDNHQSVGHSANDQVNWEHRLGWTGVSVQGSVVHHQDRKDQKKD